MKYWLILILLAVLISCQKVVVVVDELPKNTPINTTLYITGTFNYWDPGDPYFPLEQKEDGKYYITLPKGKGDIEYKFTRGDWTTVEADICGNQLGNRFFHYGDEDTLHVSIDSWLDLGPTECPYVTLMVNDIPENTPKDDLIYVAGNFNSWHPGNDTFALKRNDQGYFYTLNFDKKYPTIEYKFTRGGWENAEADKNGLEVPKRSFRFGQADSLFLSIEGWVDITPNQLDFVTFVIDRLPANTPEDDPLHIVGSFNNWYPRDKNYILNKVDGKYMISLPQPDSGIMEYKFTRGGWDTVEGEYGGARMPNRSYEYGTADTVHITIRDWENHDD